MVCIHCVTTLTLTFARNRESICKGLLLLEPFLLALPCPCVNKKHCSTDSIGWTGRLDGKVCLACDQVEVLIFYMEKV